MVAMIDVDIERGCGCCEYSQWLANGCCCVLELQAASCSRERSPMWGTFVDDVGRLGME